jgi:polysaccharide biosynthesis transport protein
LNIVDPRMLQGTSPLAGYSDHSPQAAPQLGASGITFDFVFDFARRRFWTIFFCVLLTSGIGITYFFAVPAPYTAVATLAIDTRKFQLFQQPANLGEQLIDSTAAVESQLEVLKSENIALKVIKELNLADDAEFGKGGSIPVISNLFETRRLDSPFWRTRNALRIFEKSLKVKRLGVAYVIDISFESVNAEHAARIANAIAEAYIADQLDAKYQSTRQGSAWLEGRIRELRDQVSVAQKAVNDYKAKNKIVDTGNGRLVTDQKLSELNSELTIARARSSEARARFDRINAVLKDDASDATIVNAGVSDVINNQLITRLRTQYLEAASRESEWSEKYGRNHLAAVNLRNNMRATRNAIRSELQRLGESYKNDYEVASEAEKNLEKELQQAVVQSQVSNEAQVTLRELETSAQAYKALHDNFLRRYTEAVEQQSFPYTEARLITQATPPLQRTYRKTLLIIALTPFAGLFMGAGLAALREFLDRGFRTSSQVEKVLHTNCLALVPRQKEEPAKQLTRQGTGAVLATAISEPYRGTWAVIEEPFSRFAEAIRAIKLAIDLNGAVSTNKVIGLTSSVPNEGKSSIAAALARSITQIGARSILIDCDLRNPSLSRAIAPDATAGLLEVLSNSEPLEKAIWKEPSTGMAFLPAALKFRVAHSSEILASNAMKALIDRLRSSYDYVIVDLPPLAPIVDVRATTHFVDSYIFVVEWGRTYTAVAQHALSKAPQIHERLLGAVLNKVDMRVLGLYDGNRANYYNNKSYERYGYND